MDISELRKVLDVGKSIRESLRKTIADIDDAEYDMANSDDHETTSKKLCTVLDDIDNIPSIPKSGIKKEKGDSN